MTPPSRVWSLRSQQPSGIKECRKRKAPTKALSLVKGLWRGQPSKTENFQTIAALCQPDSPGKAIAPHPSKLTKVEWGGLHFCPCQAVMKTPPWLWCSRRSYWEPGISAHPVVMRSPSFFPGCGIRTFAIAQQRSHTPWCQWSMHGKWPQGTVTPPSQGGTSRDLVLPHLGIHRDLVRNVALSPNPVMGRWAPSPARAVFQKSS